MVENQGCVFQSENIASLVAHAWPQNVTPGKVMSGIHKIWHSPSQSWCHRPPQTSASQVVGGKMAQV